MEEGKDSLESTPTWAVAGVCAALILVAVLAEHALSLLTLFLRRRKRKTLNQALYHVKAELRSFGFMSLLLNVAQQPISKICIPENMAASLLPCKKADHPAAALVKDTACPKGRVPLLSSKGTEQLLLLIIMLAVSHVVSCLLIFGLGMAKMKKWESWEEETRTLEYQLSTDPRRFKLTRDTSFGRRHLKIWSNHHLLLWLGCFFRQFSTSVSKADYLALRHGFIVGHFPQDQTLDFHKFLRRSLDNDFAVVAGISHWSWTYAILFMFSNAQGMSRFYSYFWLPLIPLMMLLIVGTKLEVTITRMCLESSSEGSIVPGTFCVRPNNNYFWFQKPRFILQIIHFILFQNAFQVAFFIWAFYKFGFPSCFHRETEGITLSIGIGGIVQILCAYITLPLYALVTRIYWVYKISTIADYFRIKCSNKYNEEMKYIVGSSKTEIIFTEDIIRGLRNWRRAARKNLATRSRADSGSRHTAMSREPEPSSPVLPADYPSPRHLHSDDMILEAEQYPSGGMAGTCDQLEKYTFADETLAKAEGEGEEKGRSDEHGATAYDGEMSFGTWQEHRDCEMSEQQAEAEAMRGP